MLSTLFWGAFALLALQFGTSFAAAASSDAGRAAGWFAKALAGVNWLFNATARAGAASGRWARARWDAWRASR